MSHEDSGFEGLGFRVSGQGSISYEDSGSRASGLRA